MRAMTTTAMTTIVATGPDLEPLSDDVSAFWVFLVLSPVSWKEAPPALPAANLGGSAGLGLWLVVAPAFDRSGGRLVLVSTLLGVIPRSPGAGGVVIRPVLTVEGLGAGFGMVVHRADETGFVLADGNSGLLEGVGTGGWRVDALVGQHFLVICDDKDPDVVGVEAVVNGFRLSSFGAR